MQVVNIRKAELNKRHIANFQEWTKLPNTLYIGRNMEYYVPGTIKSKWHNPYSVQKYGLDTCLQLYENHIMNSNLKDDLHELEGKELGCWCKPNKCHGDILIKLHKSLG